MNDIPEYSNGLKTMHDTQLRPVRFTSIRRWTAIALLAGGAIGWFVQGHLRTDSTSESFQFVRRPVSVQTRDDAELLSGWLDQIENGWEVGKNHERVRSAFSSVIADARRSTVRIFRDGKQVALGTIVDSDGYLLTKASEVLEPGRITCQLSDRRKKEAEVVKVIQQHDLALLHIDATNLVAAKWHQGTTPEVGSLLATTHLGSQPLAVGVVSLAPQRIANDGVLGVRLRDSESGPMVTEVINDSSADRAGIRRGDLVVRVDEQQVHSSDELVSLISQRFPGDDVSLEVKRSDETVDVTATLGRRTDLDFENIDFQSFLGGELSRRRTGFAKVLQHDTFLMPEHCGGPLVDLEGHVVGINIARAERIASYALPAQVIVPLLQEWKQTETTARVASGK